MSDYYWHFCQVDGQGVPRLGHGDGREVRVGETLCIDQSPVLCSVGLHASRRALDALKYARSNALMFCRVTLGGTVLHDDDKSVAAERTVVAMLDTTTTERLLREFARWCALRVVHLWDAPEIVRQYLETGDETISAAASAAAWNAASAAARDAARAAASAAASDAASDAARDAARDAASAAAWAAARDAAWAAARDAASAATRDATWAAAWDAASAAARDAQNAQLERMALEAMQIQGES